MKLGSAPVWLLLTSILGALDASASRKMKSPNSDVLRVKLANPARTPLSASAIRESVSGKLLILDQRIDTPKNFDLRISYGECPPYEKFYYDGRWERQYCGRAPMVETGTWSVKTSRFNSELCVISDAKEEYCRTVWGRSSSDTLIMTVRGRLPGSDPEYNPYRTVPLNVR